MIFSPEFEALYPFGGLQIQERRSSAFSLKLTGWKPVVCILRMENQNYAKDGAN